MCNEYNIGVISSKLHHTIQHHMYSKLCKLTIHIKTNKQKQPFTEYIGTKHL